MSSLPEQLEQHDLLSLPKVMSGHAFYSSDGYLVDLLGERWTLSKDIHISVAALSEIFPGDDQDLRKVLEFYAKLRSASHTKNIAERLFHYVRNLQGNELFSPESIISYRSSLERSREWYVGLVRVLIKQWDRLGYPGIPSETLALLDELVLKGNERGWAVQSMCPDDGPLTDIEMQGLLEATINAFVAARLRLENTCLVMLLAMTGRRPVQIAALKIKDLISDSSGKYWINFPRAKQRGMPWRSSFNKFAIIEDLWLLLQQQVAHVRSLFAEALGVDILPSDFDGNLPLFPNMRKLQPGADVHELLSSDKLHIRSQNIYGRIKRVAELVGVVSERTGHPMQLNPNRFRYTLGTNIAREGGGVFVIAEALDHSNTQNAGVYVKNIPDIVKRIDKAVALQLAPIAQAFQGVLISSEREARRGNDPSSRISNGRANVGSCGSYGFCSAHAPIACYTCAHFQPWIDGAHEEVLDRLIEDRDRVAEQTEDLKIAAANDRLILAVGDVIQRCKIAKEEMANG